MKKYLYTAVFISGMTSLAVEMLASRLLGNIFGTSNLVWASIIGLILIYLAAGNFLGGYWADKSPSYQRFFSLLLWAALTIGIIPVISRPVLRYAADAFDVLELGILFGSFTSVIILFCIPVILLGTASPFAIRLAVHDARIVGSISGKIYAISTLGSFFGTFIPVLWLIPTIGTYHSILAIAAFLMLFSLLGLGLTSGIQSVLKYFWMPAILLIFIIWGLPGSDKSTQGQIYETESAYNYIQVLDIDGYHLLRLNEGQGVHSIYHPIQLNYYGPWEQVLVAPFFNPAPYEISQVKSMAVIGLAAGTTARQACIVYPDIEIDGFEIDGKIVEVAKEYFDMNNPNLNIIVQDGRWGLSHSHKKYNIISIDAYRPPYIPYYMTTIEFFRIVQQHLSIDGVIVMNIGRGPQDRQLLNVLYSTVHELFPSVYIVDIPGTFNSVLFATNQKTSSDNLFYNYMHLVENGSPHPLLLDTMKITAANLQPSPEITAIFTDDHAPIEWITNNMVLKYLFYEESDLLQ